MFDALLLEKTEAGFQAGVRSTRRVAAARRRRAAEGRALDDQLQGRARHHQRRRWCAHGRWWPASTALAPCSRARTPAWKAGRPRRPQRLGRRRDALGLPGAEGPAHGRRGWCAVPEAFSTRQAMAIGTAGYTAMLCVLALERHGVDAGRRRGARDRRHRRRRQRRRSRCWRKLGYSRGRRPARPHEADYLKRLGARARHRPRRTRRRPASRCRRNAGPRSSTRSAATRWPTPARRRATAASSRPAAWPRASTARHRDAVHPARRDARRASTA